MSSFPLCKRTEEIIYPAGICKVQLTCNANRKMEIDRLSFSFFGEIMQNKTDMTNLARSDNRLLDHLLILDFGTPLIERNVALLCQFCFDFRNIYPIYELETINLILKIRTTTAKYLIEIVVPKFDGFLYLNYEVINKYLIQIRSFRTYYILYQDYFKVMQKSQFHLTWKRVLYFCPVLSTARGTGDSLGSLYTRE